MTKLQIKTPKWAIPLLKAPNARYLGAYGGRGSGKSHLFAEMVIERMLLAKTDIVCVREVQRSLKQSVKKLLEGKIREMKVSPFFTITEREIRAKNGGIIIFEGMQNHTADTIKSLEGFDVAWIEEAQSISQFSLEILRPTIRKPGSQIWATWNPRLESDPIETLLRGPEPPPDAVVVSVNWEDNPWFPSVLRKEMLYDRERDPDKYAHIWLGEYVRNSEARVFRNWEIDDFEAPEDAIHRLGADWGFASDPTVLVRCHIIGRTLYIDHEAYQVGCEITDTPSLFMSIPEAEKWPMVADSSRPETISHMRRNGFPKIQPAVKGPKSVEEGVEWLKSFDIVVHPRCQHVIDELTLYSYKTDALTGQVLPVLADRDNHCIAEGELVFCERGMVPIEHVTTDDRVWTRGGFQRVLFADVTDINRDTVIVETTNGAVRCTPDHEIWTHRGFVRADALRYDDELLLLESSSWSRSSNGTAGDIGDIPTASMPQPGHIFKEVAQAETHICTGISGKTRTARSRTAGTFIILMAIPATMISAIWKPFAQKSTPDDTSGAPNALRNKQSIWIASETRRKLGTHLQKVAQSMQKSGSWLMRRLFPFQSLAFAAELSSSPEKSETQTSIARTNASQRPGEKPEWTTKHVHAAFVESPLKSTNTAKPALVPGRVVTVRAAGQCARVYDLTVENHHEFVCGGVLVSNCIDALRYACEGARRAQYSKKPVDVELIPTFTPLAR